MGFIGHDAGHRQIFRTRWKNDIVGLVHSNLLLGVSYGWWTNKHNQHHANPNHFDLDPDINVPVLAFSEEQALSKQRFLQPMMKYQAYFFFPLLSLAAFSLRMGSLRFLLLQKKGKFPPPEALLLVIHFVLYFGLLFYLLDVWQALLFIAVHQMLFGLYMGSVFAPNHKGMLTQGKDSRLSFLHQQVFTARNVKAHALTDFWYGGLNYQIEHHLFPSMSRNKLSEAQKIIKAFCQVHSIAYYETGVLQSYREILQYLHQVSAPLRK
jgi:fatty acid desaturase